MYNEKRKKSGGTRMDEEEALYWRIKELEKKYSRNQNLRTLLVIGGYAFFISVFSRFL